MKSYSPVLKGAEGLTSLRPAICEHRVGQEFVKQAFFNHKYAMNNQYPAFVDNMFLAQN